MATTTPRVPIQTPMYDDRGNLTRTWIIFFERLGLRGGEGTGAGPYIRVLLLKDLTVGTDVAEHQYIFLPEGTDSGTGRRIVALLRTAITSDLVVKFRNVTAGADIATVTIPASTSVDDPVEVDISDQTFSDKDVIAPDILASDGTFNGRGICAITLEWESA